MSNVTDDINLSDVPQKAPEPHFEVLKHDKWAIVFICLAILAMPTAAYFILQYVDKSM